MEIFNKILAALGSLAQGAGAVVDAAVPVANGDRTKISALVAVLAPVLCKAIAPFSAQGCDIISGLGAVATAALPLFAFAGLVRK